MRLTLRTLLAYMDGLLDPKDSQEIGKKIEESKFATDLFHKIRDVMRRLRLAAPSISERTTNLDCNTVAEYLDNALPADRVPDFEEVSLKSEMHLAEVASCHQILTMVLGEPVEIDPESRQRMYQLPTVAGRVDEEHLAAVEAATMLSGDGNGPIPSAAPPVKARPRPVVPEYLRDPPRKSRLLPAAAIMLFVGAAIGLSLLMLGQFNPDKPLGKAFYWVQAKMHGKPSDDDDRDDGKGKLPARLPEDSVSGVNGTAGLNGKTAPKSSESASAMPVVTKDTGNPLAPDKREVPVPTAEKSLENPGPGKPPAGGPDKVPDAAGTASQPPGVASLPAGPATTPPASGTRPGNAENSPVKSVAGPRSNSTEPTPPPGRSQVGPPPEKSRDEVARVDSSLAPGHGAAPSLTGQVNPPPAVENKTRLGRFMSDGQDVLLKLEANNSGWRRVLPEEFLAGRQPLLALPSYRPRVVVLNVGATLELDQRHANRTPAR